MGKRKDFEGIICSKPRKPRLQTRRAQLDGSYVDGYLEYNSPNSSQHETSDISLPLLPQVNPPDADLGLPSTDVPQEQEQSRYRLAKEREMAQWEEIRDQLLDTATQLAAPVSSICSFCGEEESHPIKCDDCGPTVVYCSDCCIKLHLTPAHFPEQWHEDHYKPFELDNLDSTILERPDHPNCPSRTLKPFKVFNHTGRLCSWQIYVCGHEAEACTLLRFNLWAASPERPQTAFSTELLEWLTALTLECQVSVKGFCNAVRWRSGLSKQEVDTLYRALIGQSMAEFHHHLYKQRTLLHLSTQLNDGTVCPACPTGDGEMIISLDANFGLVRKRSSGTSVVSPLHQGRYFLPDEAVKNFMAAYSEDSKPPEDCNNFQAGSSVRSRSRQEKLDVTGIFGAVCRHSIPVKFLDMNHGERLGYPVYMIQHLLSTVQPGKSLKMHIMYDIACIVHAHLNNPRQCDLLSKIELAIPIFHCYGHKPSCQVLYSPRRKEGFGLTDGEGVERLWSYLRGFSSITKEMTPSHRTDLLTDGLLHYGRRKVADMSVSLAESFDKAEKTYKLATEDLANILQQAPVAVSEEDVEVWRQSELDLIAERNRARQSSTVRPWKKTYVLHLSAFFSVRSEMQSCTDGILRSALMKQYKELEQKLELTERKHRRLIGQTRWEEHDENYKSTLLQVDQEERMALMDKLWRSASERTFLLSLKRKYSDGQAIAKKLMKQLKTVNKKLRKTIAKYNSISSCRPPQNTLFPRTVDFDDASQPTWQCYMQLDLLDDGAVPRLVQRQAIEALCLKRSAEEELRMTSQDICRLIETGVKELQIIEESLKTYRNAGNVGAVAMLLEKQDALESHLKFAHSLLRTKNPHLPNVPKRDDTDWSLDNIEYMLDSDSEDSEEEEDEEVDLPDVPQGDDNDWYMDDIVYMSDRDNDYGSEDEEVEHNEVFQA